MSTATGPVDFTDRIHTSDGHSFSVEELYQAFKQRQALELKAMPEIFPAKASINDLKQAVKP